MFGQFTLRNDSAAMVHKVGKHTKLMAGEFDQCPVQRDSGCARIEGDCTALKFRNDLSCRASNEGTKACEQFLHAERLRHVIVGAAVDALNLFVPTSTGGQNEDRHRDAGCPPSLKDGKTVDFGKAEIQDRRVVRFSLSEEVCSLAVGGAIDRIAGTSNRLRELFAQAGFILDNQNPQANLHAHLSWKSAERQMNGTFKARSSEGAYLVHKEDSMKKLFVVLTLMVILAASVGSASAQQNLAGPWTMSVHGMSLQLVMAQDGDKISGTLETPHGTVRLTGDFSKGKLTLSGASAEGHPIQFAATATVAADGSLTGRIAMDVMEMDFTAVRAAKK